jgi:hypothetical protein
MLDDECALTGLQFGLDLIPLHESASLGEPGPKLLLLALLPQLEKNSTGTESTARMSKTRKMSGLSNMHTSQYSQNHQRMGSELARVVLLIIPLFAER